MRRRIFLCLLTLSSNIRVGVRSLLVPSPPPPGCAPAPSSFFLLPSFLLPPSSFLLPPSSSSFPPSFFLPSFFLLPSSFFLLPPSSFLPSHAMRSTARRVSEECLTRVVCGRFSFKLALAATKRNFARGAFLLRELLKQESCWYGQYGCAVVCFPHFHRLSFFSFRFPSSLLSLPLVASPSLVLFLCTGSILQASLSSQIHSGQRDVGRLLAEGRVSQIPLGEGDPNKKYLAKSLCVAWLCWCWRHAACIPPGTDCACSGHPFRKLSV